MESVVFHVLSIDRFRGLTMKTRSHSALLAIVLYLATLAAYAQVSRSNAVRQAWEYKTLNYSTG